MKVTTVVLGEPDQGHPTEHEEPAQAGGYVVAKCPLSRSRCWTHVDSTQRQGGGCAPPGNDGQWARCRSSLDRGCVR